MDEYVKELFDKFTKKEGSLSEWQEDNAIRIAYVRSQVDPEFKQEEWFRQCEAVMKVVKREPIQWRHNMVDSMVTISERHVTRASDWDALDFYLDQNRLEEAAFEEWRALTIKHQWGCMLPAHAQYKVDKFVRP